MVGATANYEKGMNDHLEDMIRNVVKKILEGFMCMIF